MQSFYSILRFSPNSRTSDSLGVGLILFDGLILHFLHSENKLSIAKKLAEGDSRLLDFVIKEISSRIKELNKTQLDRENTFFADEPILALEYFEYLNQYSHGLITFSKPRVVADKLDDKKMDKLFELFIDRIPHKEGLSNHPIRKQFRARVERNLINKVSDKVHVNQVFSSKTTPILLSDFSMDCIGKNGALVGAKAIPFDTTKKTLHSKISTYVNVAAHLSASFSDLKADSFFLIADEPSKDNTEAYNYYTEIRRNEKLFKVLSSSDSSQVADLIEERGAQTFLEF